MTSLTLEKFGNLLGPFADPATEVSSDENSEEIRIQMIRDGVTRTYVYHRSSATFESRQEQVAPTRYATLASLLASAELANLRGLASTQKRVFEHVLEEKFIEPSLRIEPDTDHLEGERALDQILATPSTKESRVVLLDGPAGGGKTRLLERLVARRAEDYLRGRGRPLLLVRSHGRRLSNLPDALNTTTVQLRAQFSSEHVPILVREGLLDLAIDGFDELVDADGYADAWYALRGLLEQLDGRGTCVFAARDTFFDQQSFHERLQAKARHSISLIQISLKLIPPERALQWLLTSGTWEEGSTDVLRELLRPDSYTLRPFFLTQLAKHPSSLSDLRSPRDFLVGQFLAREAGVLMKMDLKDLTPERARQGLINLFQETAFDMVERESEEIDVEYLNALCELAFGEILQPDDLRKLQHKVGSFGLFERTAKKSLVRFLHSELQHHFFAHGLFERLEHGSIPFPLRRGVFGADFLEVLQDVADFYDPDRLACGVRCLSQALARDSGTDRFATNSGGILLALLVVQRDDLPLVQLADLEIAEGVLRGTCRRANIERCLIHRLDVRGADLRQVVFVGGSVLHLVADEETLFGDAIPTVERLDAQSLRHRDPVKIHEWIAAHQEREFARAGADVRRFPFENFFDRVCRQALRHFWFREGGDSSPDPLRDPFWPELEQILGENGRLRRNDSKTAGGRAAVFLHILNPEGLLRPASEEDRVVRQRVTMRARELAEYR